MNLVLGIDGGGTSCRAAVADSSGAVLGRGRSGPSNIRSDFDFALQNILEAARLAFAEAGIDASRLNEASALLGLAGANVGDYAERLLAKLPFKQSRIESDALIALEGALGEHDGAIAVLGTGSVYMARRAGAVRSLGGWGFLIGDLGSGARLGRDLLQETLLAYDGIRPGSDLSRIVLEHFGNDPSAVVEFTTNAKPGDYAAFAPHVFKHAGGDVVADRVLNRALHHVEETLDALKLEGDERLCLLGGLAPFFGAKLSDRHSARLMQPQQDALGGAVAMAARLFGEGAPA